MILHPYYVPKFSHKIELDVTLNLYELKSTKLRFLALKLSLIDILREGGEYELQVHTLEIPNGRAFFCRPDSHRRVPAAPDGCAAAATTATCRKPLLPQQQPAMSATSLNSPSLQDGGGPERPGRLALRGTQLREHRGVHDALRRADVHDGEVPAHGPRLRPGLRPEPHSHRHVRQVLYSSRLGTKHIPLEIMNVIRPIACAMQRRTSLFNDRTRTTTGPITCCVV